ncbi:MAG: hypothetical protein ACTSUE_01155 [Promethearchaeota archaeon]
MIISAFKEIGAAIRKPHTPEERELISNEKILSYIKLTYPNTPNPSKILTMEFSTEDVLVHLREIMKAVTVATENGDFNNINVTEFKKKNGFFKIPKSGNSVDKFVKDLLDIVSRNLSPGKKLDDLLGLLTIIPGEYDDLRHDGLRMLRGNQKGTRVYFSPTMFCTCNNSQHRLKEFPLWKINLSGYPGFQDEKLKEFFNYFPNVNNFSQVNMESSESIFKFLLSILFLKAINGNIQDDWDLRRMIYVVPVIDGRWPYQVPDFVDYYSSCLDAKSGNKGICEICGNLKQVSDGLTGELGFYTKNQEGFAVIGMKSGNLMCDECKDLTQLGFSYVKENLEYYIANRGTNKSPIMSYLIPYSPEPGNLLRLLKSIRNPSKNALENIISIGNVLDGVRDSEGSSDEGKEEADELDDLLSVLGLVFEEKYPYSLMVVTFYHPEGQSKNFHNILDIINMDYQKCVKIRNAIVKVRSDGNRLMIKHLHHIFGISAVENIRKLLRMESFNMEKLCSDVFRKTKRKFLEDIMKNVGKKQLSSFDIRKFKWFLDLSDELELIEVEE